MLKIASLAAAIALLLAPLLAPLGAVAAPAVILAGDAGGNGPGSIVDDGLVVTVPAGASVMFNDAQGRTRVLAGPYQGPLSGEGAKGASGLERLLATRQAEQSRLGAIRAAPGQAPRDASVISIAQSSAQCLPAGAEARLWRPEAMNADSSITVTAAENGSAATLIWHAGEETLAWPETPALVSGARYIVRLDIAPRPVEIVVHQADRAFASKQKLAAWMSEMGCRRQALALLEDLTG